MAKRLVNVYRLIKASHPEVVASKLQQNATLFLLAVLFGRPAIAGELFRCLYEARPPFADPHTQIAEAMTSWAALDGRDGEAAQKIERSAVASHVSESNLELTVADCRDHPAVLARYSFVTGHDWHTWRRRTTAPLRAPPAGLATQSFDS